MLGGKPLQSGSELAERLDRFEWECAKVMPAKRWKAWAGAA